MIAGRDGKIFILETELAEAFSALSMTERHAQRSLTDIGLRLGEANSKLTEIESKADEEFTTAAKFPVMKELLDEELTAANAEIIRVTSKKEEQKNRLAEELARREKVLQSEVGSEK